MHADLVHSILAFIRQSFLALEGEVPCAWVTGGYSAKDSELIFQVIFNQLQESGHLVAILSPMDCPSLKHAFSSLLEQLFNLAGVLVRLHVIFILVVHFYCFGYNFNFVALRQQTVIDIFGRNVMSGCWKRSGQKWIMVLMLVW
jgi:hypothetical protein